MNAAAQPTFKAGQAWLVVIISIFASLTVAMVTFKAMVTAGLMMAYFEVDIAVYGSITAACGAMSIVGSIPAGIFVAKLGPRKLMIIDMICFVVSGFIQIAAFYAGLDFLVFSILGCLGGFVYGNWTVNGPMLTTAYFPAEKRPLPNSISTCWVTLAMMVLLIVGTPILMMGGVLDPYAQPDCFINIWWVMTILQIVALVLIVLFVRMPKPENSFMVGGSGEGAAKGKFSDGLKNPGTWCLLIMFIVYGFITAAYGNYFPTYLENDAATTGLQGGFAMSVADANGLSSIATYVMLALNLCLGFVLNKVPNKYFGILCLVSVVFVGVMGVWMFMLADGSIAIVFLILYGVASQLYPPVCWTALPEIVDSQSELSAAMGVIALSANVAGVSATAATGIATAAAGGYIGVSYMNIVLTIIGLAVAVVFLRTFTKKYNAHHAGDGDAEVVGA